MRIQSTSFGFTSAGSEVFETILSNNNGFSAHIINYGAALRKLYAGDINMVLGYDTVGEYEKNLPYLGVTVGRYAGRIQNASFALDGSIYSLENNNNGGCLHGGIKGLSRALWTIESIYEDDQMASISMTYLSPDGEDGFPGNVHFSITYTVTSENELKLSYGAKTDKATPVNLTNHSYFNLNGSGKGNILDHILTLDADGYIESDSDCLGVREAPVTGTPFDFRSGKRIGDGKSSGHPQTNLFGGYDHVFRINSPGQFRKFATLVSPLTGIEMSVSTDTEAVVLYTSNFMDDSLALCDGARSSVNLGVCLETQYFPNDLNADFIETKTILRPGDKYIQNTAYSFRF